MTRPAADITGDAAVTGQAEATSGVLPEEILHALTPMHVVLTPEGRIRQAGPTLHKIVPRPLEGAMFVDIFDVYRPWPARSMAQLLQTEGRKLSLRLRPTPAGPADAQNEMADDATQPHDLKGMLVATGDGGAVMKFGFGLGLLEAVHRNRLTSTDFSPTDLAIEMLWLMEAKALAFQASRSLNTRLQDAMVRAEERAFTDTLTGLRNRRALDATLERITRQGQAFSLMHLDLDLFKQVNDTMGHAAGDHVLRTAARAMLEETRKDDTVARVGGDEFVIVFASLTRPPRLAELAERLISRIEQPVPWEGRLCRISASIGITIAEEGSPLTPEQMIDQADVALYASKRAGRARFTFFDPKTMAGGMLQAMDDAEMTSDVDEKGMSKKE